MRSRRFHIPPVAIIVATILILGAAIWAVLMTIARAGDAHQRDIEQRIIESALDQQRQRLSGMLEQQAYWGAAYDHMDDVLDVQWLDTNLGNSAAVAGVPETAIFNSRARVVYQFISSHSHHDADSMRGNASLSALVERVLAMPALPPRALTAFVRIGDNVELAGAERIIPDDARSSHPLTHRYVLAYLLPLDAPMLRNLESGFGIARLSVSTRPPQRAARIGLADASGRPLAYLGWRPARPGHDFANAAAPLALGCFVLLAALQLVVLRSWMQVAQKMQDDGLASTAFLANVSHELRTPLNAIIGFSDCMVSEMFGPLSSRYQGYAQDIQTSGQLLLGIVNDVLDLTQLNSAAEVTMQPVRPSQVLAGPVRMLREYAKCDHIAINFVDRSGDAEVAANEKALSQILLNLGSNAVKFSAPRSSVDVILERSRDHVDLIVRDRGAGIPPDKLRFIGQPFFQAHHGAVRRPGSGLGLAIVKKLTERLGGQFELESRLGSGTTATVRLPQLCAAAEPAASRAA